MSENTNTLEFYGKALLNRVKEELPGSYVEQTGGGTATLMFFKGTGVPGELQDGEVVITAGPGSYNWNQPDESVFNSDEFYFGRSDYDFAGNEFPDDVESERMDPENPHLDVVAERILAKYREYNNPEVVAAPSTPAHLPGNPYYAEAARTDYETVDGHGAAHALLAVAWELRTGNMIAVKGYVNIEEIAQRMGYSVNNPV